MIMSEIEIEIEIERHSSRTCPRDRNGRSSR